MKHVNASKNRDGQVDIRDDEDQGAKLVEIIQLLVAAGYFRARIKGLSPFDKIVGGMTWCIEICNFDVDVDLLFNENLTIGQKIGLTERIVNVLPLMKCPHRIEPHQIQGLDAIHIFPVIQWLVKRALETRAEYDDDNRSYSVTEYHRHYTTPLLDRVESHSDKAMMCFDHVKSIYGPKRRWRRKLGATPLNIRERLQMTLLEYGDNTIAQQSKEGDKDETDGETNEMNHVDEMMKNMDIAEQTQNKLSAAHVGHIVSGGAQEIIDAASNFTKLQQQIQNEILDNSVSSQEKKLAKLETQNQKLKEQSVILGTQQKEVLAEHEQVKLQMQDVKQMSTKLQNQIKDLQLVDTKENQQLVQQLSELVEANENARKKEAIFKDTCRNQAEALKQQINDLEKNVQDGDIGDELAEKYELEREKYTRMRSQLAKKTRKVEALKRSIDDIPGRAELSQYQRRFVELYNQIASTHRETSQFYNMYNTLADSKTYMEKELTLLNSILDNMAVALKSSSALEDFIHQLDNIVEGIRQNKMKLEQRRGEEKACKSGLSSELSRHQELNRQYAKTVHILSQEINKNELLHEKLNSL